MNNNPLPQEEEDNLDNNMEALGEKENMKQSIAIRDNSSGEEGPKL